MAQTSPTVPVKRLTPDQLSALPPIEDFSDLIAARQLAWERLEKLTGEKWSWSHPRIAAWMEKVGARNCYCLPYGRYEFLVKSLWNLIEELERNGRK